MSDTAYAPIELDAARPISFATLVRVELRKSYDTRAGWWLLLVTGLLATVAMVAVLVVVVTQDQPIRFGDFVATTNYTSGFLLPVLGILLVTSEWTQRTAMVTFTLEPRRVRVILAKLVAGLVLAGVVAAVATAAAVLANLLYGVLQGHSDWRLGLVPFLGFLASQVLTMLGGFAMATLFLNTPVAIVVYFAYRFVVPTIFAIMANFLHWFASLQPWVDFAAAQVPMLDGHMSGKDWEHLLVSGFIWLVLPVAVGLWRVLRAEVK